MVVFVSDGKESCGGDPCPFIRNLRARGVKVEVHVVGFDVNPQERAQLQCIAKAGGGEYYNAQNALELKEVLEGKIKQTIQAKVDRRPPPKPETTIIKRVRGTGLIHLPLQNANDDVIVRDTNSKKEVGRLTYNYVAVARKDTLVVPAGAYTLQFGKYIWTVEIPPSRRSAKLPVGLIHVRLQNANDDVIVRHADSAKEVGRLTYNYVAVATKDTLVVPAGRYTLQFAHQTMDIDVEPGKKVIIE